MRGLVVEVFSLQLQCARGKSAFPYAVPHGQSSKFDVYVSPFECLPLGSEDFVSRENSMLGLGS